MGTVYLAHDEKMRREVALKVLSRHSSWEAAARRFEQEAWLAGRLDHPNIVKVYERGQWEELSYYAMELMDGGSLADVIEHQRRSGRDPGLELASARARRSIGRCARRSTPRGRSTPRTGRGSCTATSSR
jgi:serine/threonine protein kinase